MHVKPSVPEGGSQSNSLINSLRTHMQNIKDITGNIHYEMYRVRRLNESNVHFISSPPEQPVTQPKANGQPAEPPSSLQTNGVAAQHEVLSHEM